MMNLFAGVKDGKEALELAKVVKSELDRELERVSGLIDSNDTVNLEKVSELKRIVSEIDRMIDEVAEIIEC